MNNVSKRELWIDYVKVIACFLVLLGHFLQSMVKSNILSDNMIYQWFNISIYTFHVPLFFICSGYVYQKYSKVFTVNEYFKNIRKKALALGIPYFIFSIITWCLKKIFSGSVNSTAENGIIDSLFLTPLSPYWFLYTLFFMFLITPNFKNKKNILYALLISILAKLFICNFEIPTFFKFYAITSVMNYFFWFIFGMFITKVNIKNINKTIGFVVFFIFLLLSLVGFNSGNSNILFLEGILACISIIVIVYNYESFLGRMLNIFAKYTMPIFLMHTIFAAPLRSILLKIRIYSFFIHFVLGVLFSLIGPMIVAEVSSKSKYLEFFLYPSKYITK